MGSSLDAQSLMAMLPKPQIATSGPPLPIAPPPVPVQPPFTPAPTPVPVNIQLTVARDDNGQPRRDQEGRPVYVPAYGPEYGAGYYPGTPYIPGIGGIGTYPGAAADASIKIGAINSSLSQGNVNWGAGQQSLGAVFPVPTDSPVPTTAPPIPTFRPEPPLYTVPMPPMEVVAHKSKWPQYLIIACVAIALGVAFYILYTRFIKKKKNSNNNSGNRASTGNSGRNAGATAAAKNANTAADVGFDDDFGDEDFGDFDTPAPTRSATR